MVPLRSTAARALAVAVSVVALAATGSGSAGAAPAQVSAAHTTATAQAPAPVGIPPFEWDTRPAWQNLALTPPMGYNDWSYFTYNFDAASLLKQARSMKDRGLVAAGYDTITIDDSWMTKDRGPDGHLVVDTNKFPDGMKAFGDAIHALGMRFGIYADAGTKTCGNYAGSQGYEDVDAKDFASWGVDYVKVDGCHVSPATPANYKKLYTAWSDALASAGRPMVFSVSAPAYFQYGDAATWHDMIKFSGDVGNLWREGDDVRYANAGHDALWASIMNNYGYNVKLPQFAGPGHWNDPDFVIVGDNGLTHDEEMAQMSLYAQMASPLIMSTDVPAMSDQQLAVLKNPEVIAVDQDKLGRQGYIVQQTADYDVLTKPLANGDTSVVLFNKSSRDQWISTKLSTVGVSGSVAVRDLWRHEDLGTTSTGLSAMVPAHGVKMYRLSSAAPVAGKANLEVSADGAAAVGQSGYVTIDVTNGGTVATGARVHVDSGSGVTVGEGNDQSVADIKPGAHSTIDLGVTVADSATTGTLILRGDVRGDDGSIRRFEVPITITAPGPHGTVGAADLPWVDQQLFQGKTPFGKNTQNDPTRPIILDGTTYPKGLGGQAGSSITVDLGGQCTRFDAKVGIDDYNLDYALSHGQPQVWSTFTLTDQNGKVLKNLDFTAPDMAPQDFSADVTGVTRLTIANNPLGANTYYAHADWAGATLTCAASEQGLPTVTAQPQSAHGSTATLTATASAPGDEPAIRWQRSLDGGKSWQALGSTATQPTDQSTPTTGRLDVTVGAAESGTRYRALFSNKAGVVASDAAVVTADGPVASSPTARSGLTNAISDGTSVALPGGLLPVESTTTVGNKPVSGLSITVAADQRAPFQAVPSISARSASGQDVPLVATVSETGSSYTFAVQGVVPAGTVVTTRATSVVDPTVRNGDRPIVTTLDSDADRLRPTPTQAARATDSDRVAYQSGLTSVLTDNTRTVLPGAVTTYTSRTDVDGPATDVKLTLTPDPDLPFSAQPTVRVLDTAGVPLDAPHVVSGDGTSSSPFVITFSQPVLAGAILTSTPAKVAATAAFDTNYTATLRSALSNGKNAADAVDVDVVDNAPTVATTLSTSKTKLSPGDSYSYTATARNVNGVARGFTINLYGVPAAPLDPAPSITATDPNGAPIVLHPHITASDSSLALSFEENLPANTTVTVKGDATLSADPPAGLTSVSVRLTAMMLNQGGDPTSIGNKEIDLAVLGNLAPPANLPSGCTMSRSPVTVTASSQNTVSENTPATNAADGDPTTFWSSQWTPSNPGLPQSITLDLGSSQQVCGLNYLPRQGNSNGRVNSYNVYAGNDPASLVKVGSGTFTNTGDLQAAVFSPVNARYLRLEGLSEHTATNTMTAAEVGFDVQSSQS